MLQHKFFRGFLMAFKLLSSASNIELLRTSISKWFCSEKFELKKRPYNDTIVIYKDNICCEHYRIIKKKNRYRFEASTKLINDNAL